MKLLVLQYLGEKLKQIRCILILHVYENLSVFKHGKHKCRTLITSHFYKDVKKENVNKYGTSCKERRSGRACVGKEEKQIMWHRVSQECATFLIARTCGLKNIATRIH